MGPCIVLAMIIFVLSGVYIDIVMKDCIPPYNRLQSLSRRDCVQANVKIASVTVNQRTGSLASVKTDYEIASIIDSNVINITRWHYILVNKTDSIKKTVGNEFQALYLSGEYIHWSFNNSFDTCDQYFNHIKHAKDTLHINALVGAIFDIIGTICTIFISFVLCVEGMCIIFNIIYRYSTNCKI